MKNFITKANLSGGDDSGTSTKWGAKESNSVTDELKLAVTATGQSLAAGTGNDPSPDLLAKALTITAQTAHSYQDSGAADAYVLTRTGLLEQPLSYVKGMGITFTTANANTGASTVNVSGLGTKAILKPGDVVLSTGDILSDGYIELIYDPTADSASGAFIITKHESSKIQAIGGSVTANALTATLAPTTLDFRSNTLSSGSINRRNIPSELSVIVPSGATLGTISSVASRLALIAIDNAGTIELAIVNLAGGNNLDETTIISTTAIDATADIANVIYSTAARTNVPFRVVGYIESTQATTGTWATPPSTIQGYGGQAFAAMSSLGYGQTWQDVKASRVLGTTYYNTTGRPIMVSAGGISTAISGITATIGGIQIQFASAPVIGSAGIGSFIVPTGASYKVDIVAGAPTLGDWDELR